MCKKKIRLFRNYHRYLLLLLLKLLFYKGSIYEIRYFIMICWTTDRTLKETDFKSLCLFIQLLWLKNPRKVCNTIVIPNIKLLNLSKKFVCRFLNNVEYSQIVLDSIFALGNFMHGIKLFDTYRISLFIKKKKNKIRLVCHCFFFF